MEIDVDDRTAYQKLRERFPAEDHKKVKKGGGEQTYVPGEKIITRLDESLTPTGWAFRVVREGLTDTEAWVLGEIVAVIDGEATTRQQYGNAPIMRGSRATTDLFKIAATDALKKAATLLGVCRYLYDEDERLEVEAEMRGQFNCAECAKPIAGVKFPDDSAMTPAEVAERSRSTYGKTLCFACSKAAKKATERATAAANGAT